MREREVMNWKKDNFLQNLHFIRRKDKVSWKHGLKLDECSKSPTILNVNMKLYKMHEESRITVLMGDKDRRLGNWRHVLAKA